YTCSGCGGSNVAFRNVKWVLCLNPACKDYLKPHILDPGEWSPQYVQSKRKKQKAQKQLAFTPELAKLPDSLPESNLRNNIPITPPTVGDTQSEGSEHGQHDQKQVASTASASFASLIPDDIDQAAALLLSGGDPLAHSDGAAKAKVHDGPPGAHPC